MLNKNTLGVKKVRGQLEAALQIGTEISLLLATQGQNR